MSKILALVQRKDHLLTISLASILFFVPALVTKQAIVGPIVNASLILSLIFLGQSQAFILAILPSTAALSSGLLPIPIAPMIPFIVLSNIIYLKTFAFLDRKNSNTLAVLGAAFLKTLFLTIIVKTIMFNLLSPAIADKLINMMTWPQLWTAIVGGYLAIAIKKHVRI
jgi:hypothetical protein